ncbi:ubiquinone biosynthesis protein COQ7-domain-containing protein [Syncephalis pseudoplumigaleata]|uniref:5-demethoxyubiquinone hydroxylase, mitochondrial n=2 Tax=Zoopagomycota TaxID=1913638 RepID=A0A4P9Z3L7_9FUNG|nr:ubiquinone biosynthesis protein COQ7-domain-containing protein [Syncephalis pseudoplumigaleata]|eukprot:RKP27056.1 ubiquinone biosynthesis protein COQ7-domain-containing protein [Syncephalis pseudoplumigaleata]
MWRLTTSRTSIRLAQALGTRPFLPTTASLWVNRAAVWGGREEDLWARFGEYRTSLRLAWPHLNTTQRDMIASMLRVNQAGEIGANYIYKGQHAVFARHPTLGPLIEHMWDQEKKHLFVFDQFIGQNRVRPTLLRPIWETAGLVVGAGTALMGKEAAMACTEAVETVIGQHYDDQLRELLKIVHPEIENLRKIIKEFRDDELEHLDTAVQHDAHKAPVYEGLSQIIKQGCKVCIEIAKRV